MLPWTRHDLGRRGGRLPPLVCLLRTRGGFSEHAIGARPRENTASLDNLASAGKCCFQRLVERCQLFGQHWRGAFVTVDRDRADQERRTPSDDAMHLPKRSASSEIRRTLMSPAGPHPGIVTARKPHRAMQRGNEVRSGRTKVPPGRDRERGIFTPTAKIIINSFDVGGGGAAGVGAQPSIQLEALRRRTCSTRVPRKGPPAQRYRTYDGKDVRHSWPRSFYERRYCIASNIEWSTCDVRPKLKLRITRPTGWLCRQRVRWGRELCPSAVLCCVVVPHPVPSVGRGISGASGQFTRSLCP
jgi:hypothetical protein